MGSPPITYETFTEFYFDTEETKNVIEWLIRQWIQSKGMDDLIPNSPNRPNENSIALISSSFRRLCRLIVTTRGLKSLGLLGESKTREELFADIESFRIDLGAKLFSEDKPVKDDKLKKFFLESIVDYIKFEQQDEQFMEIIKKNKNKEESIFQWISNSNYPAYIRIDLLTELAFRKLRKASDDQLFRYSKIRDELQELVEYGEKLIKKIESDSQILIANKNNQLFGNPSSTAALFHLRKTLIKVRYNPSPMDIFESALETLNMYKYPRDELRSIYGQIWTYHVIMRVHMFRGDQIQVELYENLIDGMVEGLTNNKFSKYQTLGKYLDVWGLTSHKKKGREYIEAVELRLMQKEFFDNLNLKWLLMERNIEERYAETLVKDKNHKQIKELKETNIAILLNVEPQEAKEISERIKQSPRCTRKKTYDKMKSQYNHKSFVWEKEGQVDYHPYNLFIFIANEEENISSVIDKELENLDKNHEKDMKKNKKTDSVQKRQKRIDEHEEKRNMMPLEIKRNRWKKSPHCSIKTGGRDRLIFGRKQGFNGPDKRELIKKIPDKFEECIDQLLTSKSPLRIAFLRIITREYLLQFTKYACSPIKNEPTYSDGSIDIVKSFKNGPCQYFKDNLERLSEEFNLMGENIARDEIEEYVKVFDEVISKPESGQKLAGEKIRDKGKKIQKILKDYVLEERPNSKLYFPRKYPRITKL
jgi:hypothetical protein